MKIWKCQKGANNPIQWSEGKVTFCQWIKLCQREIIWQEKIIHAVSTWISCTRSCDPGVWHTTWRPGKQWQLSRAILQFSHIYKHHNLTSLCTYLQCKCTNIFLPSIDNSVNAVRKLPWICFTNHIPNL